jgi:hypothetical protein
MMCTANDLTNISLDNARSSRVTRDRRRVGALFPGVLHSRRVTPPWKQDTRTVARFRVMRRYDIYMLRRVRRIEDRPVPRRSG